jgi:CAAD domains of cyanobacterial aminoacyl-tRNA synthetase
MDPEVKQDIYPEETVIDEIKVDLPSSDYDSLGSLPSSSEANEQWQKFVAKFSDFLADLPDYLTEFFGKYKRPIITIGLVFGSIVAVKLTLAILSSLNDIPLLAPTLELIGFGYSAWFVYRYLLRASSRQDLSKDFNTLKEQVLGQNSSKL